LLGPLPLLLPPTHPSTSAHSHTLTHLSSLLTTTSLLRGLPLQVSNRRFTLPRDIALKNGLVEEQVFRDGGETKGLRDACFEIGTRGMDELITARSHLKETGGKVVPGEVMPLFLSAVSSISDRHRILSSRFHTADPLTRLKSLACRSQLSVTSNASKLWTSIRSTRICKRRIGNWHLGFGGRIGRGSCNTDGHDKTRAVRHDVDFCLSIVCINDKA
jgi:hypothetical protein